MGRTFTFAAIAAVTSCLMAGTAPSSWADSQDDYYIQKLQEANIAIPDQKAASQAIEAGKFACDLNDDGYRPYEVWQRLESEYPKVDPDIITSTTSIAVLVYCPEYLG